MDAKTKEAIDLLRTLIATPSPSRDESRTADLIFAYLAEHGAAPERLHNNVFARSAGFDPARPTLLLNSHHDTVRPAASYTRDPYAPTVEGDRLYGLGSNDAGASAVSLTQTFLTQRTRPLPFNLLLALSAEEECMGEHGMRTLRTGEVFIIADIRHRLGEYDALGLFIGFLRQTLGIVAAEIPYVRQVLDLQQIVQAGEQAARFDIEAGFLFGITTINAHFIVSSPLCCKITLFYLFLRNKSIAKGYKN